MSNTTEPGSIFTIRATRTVPAEVTMSQFRRALRAFGINPDTISQSLASNPDALDQWEYSATVRRNHPLVIEMANRLNKNADQIDAVFIHANSLI